MNLLKETIDELWPGDSPAPRPPSTEGMGAAPGFRPPRTSAEAKAEETTRVAREMMDAETEQRLTKTASLRRAREERQAAEQAQAALERAQAALVKPKAKGRKRAG